MKATLARRGWSEDSTATDTRFLKKQPRGLWKTPDPPELQNVERGLGQHFFIQRGRTPGVLHRCRYVEIRLV